MDARRKQFVRMMEEALVLLRQARTAASLAPQRHLFETVSGALKTLEGSLADDEAWAFGRDGAGRIVSESGQIIGGNNG